MPARKWKDDEKEKHVLERRFGEDAYVKKLRSPAQIEEQIGKKTFKKEFSHHVKPEEAKPILVPISDNRDAIPDVGTRFDSIMDKDN
jgi:hypothetical protein